MAETSGRRRLREGVPAAEVLSGARSGCCGDSEVCFEGALDAGGSVSIARSSSWFNLAIISCLRFSSSAASSDPDCVCSSASMRFRLPSGCAKRWWRGLTPLFCCVSSSSYFSKSFRSACSWSLPASFRYFRRFDFVRRAFRDRVDLFPSPGGEMFRVVSGCGTDLLGTGAFEDRTSGAASLSLSLSLSLEESSELESESESESVSKSSEALDESEVESESESESSELSTSTTSLSPGAKSSSSSSSLSSSKSISTSGCLKCTVFSALLGLRLDGAVSCAIGPASALYPLAPSIACLSNSR